MTNTNDKYCPISMFVSQYTQAEATSKLSSINICLTLYIFKGDISIQNSKYNKKTVSLVIHYLYIYKSIGNDI